NISLNLVLNGEHQTHHSNSSNFVFSLPIAGIEEISYSFEIFDYAGNLKKTEERTFAFQKSDKSTSVVQVMNTALMTITLLLGGVISINRIAKRKKALEDV
ncbi:MAG: hypothetical protein ACFFD4_20705, partial [Candidatus Odinarchaeota archaeon]